MSLPVPNVRIGVWALALALCFGQSVRASAVHFEAWLEMANACELVISQNSDDALAVYPPGPQVIDVKGLAETSVRHLAADLSLGAVTSQGDWFLCVVRSTQAPSDGQLGRLADLWVAHQMSLIEEGHGTAVSFEDESTFDPVRVLCSADEQFTVVMAFRSPEDRGFRIGVTNSLPSSVKNPCTKAET